MTVSVGEAEPEQAIPEQLEDVLSNLRDVIERVERGEVTDPRIVERVSELLIKISRESIDVYEGYLQTSLADDGCDLATEMLADVIPIGSVSKEDRKADNQAGLPGDTPVIEPIITVGIVETVPSEMPAVVQLPPAINTETRSPKEAGIPEEFVALATNAIETILKDRGGVGTVTMGQLARIAFGGTTDALSFRNFIAAVNADDRLRRIGKESRYCITRGPSSALTATHVAKKEQVKQDQSVDQEKVRLSVEAIITNAWPGQIIPGNKLLGFAKHAGYMLNQIEVDAFMAAVASHPRIAPHEDGSFSLRNEKPKDAIDRAMDLDQEQIFSSRDVKMSRFVLRNTPLFIAGLEPRKRTYQALTRGRRLVHPNKLQEMRMTRSKNRRRPIKNNV